MTKLDDLLERQRLELLAVENRAAASIVTTYRDVLRRFRQRLAEIEGLIRQAEQLGQAARPGWLFSQQRVIRLLGEYEQLLVGFVGQAAGPITRAEADAVDLTARHVQEATVAAFGPGPPDAEARVATMFHRLPAGALQALVGKAGDGRPLGMLLADLAPDGVERVRAALAHGVGAGRGPRAIAADMVREAQVPPARALLVARDQTLRVYREATLERYRASNVVRGWRWKATLNERTCPICLAMDGSLHDLGEQLVSHPACRCTMIPVVLSWRQIGVNVPDQRPAVVAGPALFARLPAMEQKTILGPGKYAAYRAGKLRLPDLVRPTSSPTWGPGLREASLYELGLDRYAVK